MAFYAYILCCSDGSYYVGQTDDLSRRLSEHESGDGCLFTTLRRPVTLMWSQEFATRAEAKSAECQLKKWSRAKKEALIAGDFKRLSLLSHRGKQKVHSKNVDGEE